LKHILNKVTLILNIAVFICGCQSPKVKENHYNGENYIGSFDISNDDKKILFSFNSNSNSSVYEMNIDGSELSLIVNSKGDSSFVNPKYSLDGSYILFILYNSKNIESSTLCKAKSDGSEIQYLTDGKSIITEAIFTNENNKIIYCQANKYSKYSPIGVKDAHDFDIYFLNCINKETKRLTNFKAYGLNNLSEVDSTQIIFYLYEGINGGIYCLEKDKPNQMRLITPINDPRKGTNMYTNPAYSTKYRLLVFSAPYQLYSMNVDDLIANLITERENSNISKIVFFHSENKILYSKQFDNNLYTIKTNGSELKIIELNIDK
jgi:hypothetical protein